LSAPPGQPGPAGRFGGIPGLAAPLLLALLVLLSPLGRASACTLWSVVDQGAGQGSVRAEGGGALLAKNRDYSPDSLSRLVLVRPERGLAFAGLYAFVDDGQTLVAGVNEAGLGIVSATAGSVPKAQRKVPSSVKGLAARLLATSATVDEALAHKDWFSGHAPVIYMLADARKAAWVEVAPGGAVSVREKALAGNRDGSRGGVLTHTNHFLSPELAEANTAVGPSSAARLEGIQAMLANSRSYSLEDFERLGQDRSQGPDNSVFRTGSKPSSARTMAAFMAELPARGAPRLLVHGWGDPQNPWTLRLTLDQAFWKRVQPGTALLLGTDQAFPELPLPKGPRGL